MNNCFTIFRKKFKSISGFTLIELMIVVVILSFVILGLVTIFSGGVRSYISGTAQLEAQRNARQAMDRMVRELRHGSRIEKADSDPDGKFIKVKIPVIDDKEAYYVKYYWSGKKHDSLERIVSSPGGGEVKNILIDNVLNLKFDIIDSSKMKILLEVDFDKDSNPDIKLNTAVTLRNS
jgi:prepilin-type N-terminal cleavage/methylation domain-containing protein